MSPTARAARLGAPPRRGGSSDKSSGGCDAIDEAQDHGERDASDAVRHLFDWTKSEPFVEADRGVVRPDAEGQRTMPAASLCDESFQQDDNEAVINYYPDDGTNDPHVQFEAVELNELMAEAIEALPEKERMVLSLYYYEELTMKEIGSLLGVNESRVSQLHSKATLRLRSKLRRAIPNVDSAMELLNK